MVADGAGGHKGTVGESFDIAVFSPIAVRMKELDPE